MGTESRPRGPGAERLRAIRLQLNWSPAQFAAKLGVSRETVWRWEKGVSEPRSNHLARAEALLQQEGSDLRREVNELRRRQEDLERRFRDLLNSND